jgi:hypothetical protein
MKKLTDAEKEACERVELLLRRLGGKCVQVFLTEQGAEIAPVEWAGSSTGNTLAKALEDALRT